MRPRKYLTSISFAISAQDRAAVETLAEKEQLSLGEAARVLLSEGIKSRGIA